MSVRLNIEHDDAEKIAACIKNITGSVSANDIVEIVLRAPEKVPEKKQEKPSATMTSREIADILGRPHTTVVKQIAKFLCETQKEGREYGFILTSFVCSHRNRKSYPMYELTENACKEYRNLIAEYGSGIKSVMDGITRFDQAITERFHPERKTSAGIAIGSGFLLEGKPKSEYEEYCNMFNQFITGPAVEGREITELTEKYQKFYEVMKSTQLKAQESNKLEAALYEVAIEAEMQGFIYGFKLFDALLNKQLAVAI
ncbi:MAG: hypothetical protein HDR24_13130 [Lachnospiraceae bacterium]|nr:hypothetical protein [Lachnospiraceae bacterium]